VVIPEVTSAPRPEARLAPDSSTTFRFETRLDPAAFTLEKREEYFTLVEVGTHAVTLEPGKALPGDGLTLTVGLLEGGVREQVTFKLLPATGEVDAQVRVVSAPLSVPVLQARLDIMRARCEAGAFARLVLSGRIGEEGVTTEFLPVSPVGAELSATHARVYRAEGLTVVEVKLALPEAATKPWLPGEALLLDEKGQVVARPGVWLDGTRLAPGDKRTLALELDPLPGGAPRPLLLEIREKEGARTVRVQGLELRGGQP
jgi:uncharacterized protein (TIGR02268 family)